MKFLEFNKVLCLSPHPDDAEYSILGSVIKCNSTHFEIFCFSQGGDFDETTTVHRLQECIACWSASGAKNVSFTKSDRMFIKDKTVDEWISYLESKYDMKSFDCILIPSSLDTHFEHRIVNDVGVPLSRASNVAIIEYKTPSTTDRWIPNYFVDISPYVEQKIKCLQEFKSQIHRGYFVEGVIRTFNTHYNSMKRGVISVEQYSILTMYK
jgi:N-acetylglucosamine malate deacetylase 1